ncbi:MAG: VWA domain-containing protein [Planctomycetaceae bacterium]|nr:VWA domain-containing protein [Planctomycetaceae bacterium]
MADQRLVPPKLGGIIHTYQKYDPVNLPAPTQPLPDLVSPALEHFLMFGDGRRLTEAELARAVRLDPSQIAGLGPSIDALLAMLLERKRKILAKYETDSVQNLARKEYERAGGKIEPPAKLRDRFRRSFAEEQLRDLEMLWYAAGDERSRFARQLLSLVETLGQKYQVDALAAKYNFTGRTPLSVEEAIAVKEELEKIDELLKQLEEARKNAQIGLIDLDLLEHFTEPGDMQKLEELQRMVENYVREMAERQGLERDGRAFRLTPKAYRVFQGRLLERIFSSLQSARSGRHQGPILGEGAVELQATKSYEFGDSLAHMDIPQSLVNAMLRSISTGGLRGGGLPVLMKQEDIVIHRTRNSPKCATVVIMDMSGSMRYDGQYAHVKRMALALEGLIRREYPGDFLQLIEMFTFARPTPPGKIIELMPKPVTIFDPLVRLKVDMSRDDVSEHAIPPHFTNIQRALQLARQFLATQDTPNKQVILITDGLPTAHFQDSWLYMLYPADPLTEAATLREGMQCARDGITINLFLVPSWSQSEDDIRFAYRLAESTKGRVFFTAGRDLDRYVVWDYVLRKREVIA